MSVIVPNLAEGQPFHALSWNVQSGVNIMNENKETEWIVQGVEIPCMINTVFGTSTTVYALQFYPDHA